MISEVYGRATAPLDAAGIAAFRFFFGLLGVISCLRFLHYGWVEEFFVRPRFFFKYWGFEWVEPLSASGMRALFWALAALSACVAVGLFYRVAIVLFLVGFTYVQLIDATNYLNHYYLVSLLALLMSGMPLGRAYSVDAWLFPKRASRVLPAWCTWLLRFQVGVVYFFAGIAKLGEDWLLHAQPLNIWLHARGAMPLLGPLFEERLVAYAMSWAGFLFDTSIVAFLVWRRTRPFAFLVVVFFHAMTSWLFPIGMFPVIMICSATIFFSPGWPRKLLPPTFPGRAPLALPALPAPEARAPGLVGKAALGLAGFYAVFQLAMPLRAHLYGDRVIWHEQGMRFSWRVMVREKNGSVVYRVRSTKTGKVREVSPLRYLDARQAREFSGQPDLILQLGRHIAREYEAKEGAPVVVTVDAIASLNGRKAARLVSPDVDLALLEDGIAPAPWILPAPSGPPIELRSTSCVLCKSASRR